MTVQVPSYVVFMYSQHELEELLTEQFKKDSSINAEICVDHDNDSLSIKASLKNENNLTDKELERLPGYFHPDEWYLNAGHLIQRIFSAEFPTLIAYYSPDEKVYKVEVDFDHYIRKIMPNQTNIINSSINATGGMINAGS